MPSFLHSPTGQTIQASGPRAARYRRHHAFQELPDTPESPHSHEDAPERPEPDNLDPDTTDIDNMTVSAVLEWVGTDPNRARQALQAEEQGKNRITLLRKLRPYR